MFELQNKDGYIMWNIRPDGIDRQCILYRNGVEIDPMDTSEDLSYILSAFYQFVFDNLPTENRSIYLNNLPMWLCCIV